MFISYLKQNQELHIMFSTDTLKAIFDDKRLTDENSAFIYYTDTLKEVNMNSENLEALYYINIS